MKRLVTCESVRRGHPDKLCDRISDSILDAVLEIDPNAQCGIETMAAYKKIIISGEIAGEDITDSSVDIISIAKSVVDEVGYNSSDFDFENLIHSQSADIRNCVVGTPEVIGAGDQGMMFGYATNETPEMLPLPLVLAHKMCKESDVFMDANPKSGIRPDGKGQVTVEYDNVNGVSIPKIKTVVLSLQHEEWLSSADVYNIAMEHILPKAFMGYDYADAIIHINPSGRFVIGGPVGDCGLTGRKIIVDTYGGVAPHGGGAFGGKDGSKVDRSAAYRARNIAKNVISAGLADKCLVSLSYAIGREEPISVSIDTFGTSTCSDDKIQDVISDTFVLTPRGIIEMFNLNSPIYTPTSCYGHFSDSTYPWEQVGKGDVGFLSKLQ